MQMLLAAALAVATAKSPHIPDCGPAVKIGEVCRWTGAQRYDLVEANGQGRPITAYLFVAPIEDGREYRTFRLSIEATTAPKGVCPSDRSYGIGLSWTIHCVGMLP
jgi:hypothetical protein